MPQFFSDSQGAGGIIASEEALLEAFVPEKMLHRDGQVKELARCLSVAAQGRTPVNVFLYGGTGVGKTSLVKWVFREFEEHTDSVKTVYINCWDYSTTPAMLTEAVRALGIFTNLNQPKEELLYSIAKYIERTGNKLIFALDEVDRMKDKDILYSLSRANHGLVCISNDPYAFRELDARIRSSLSFSGIEFPEYNPAELFDILKDRAKYTLVPGSVSDENLRIIAHAAKGDARRAIDLLRRSALQADRDAGSGGKSRIESSHIKAASESRTDVSSVKERNVKALHDNEKLILEILGSEKSLSSGDLLAKLEARKGSKIQERTYRYYMDNLVKKGLVKPEGTGRWRSYAIAE